MRLHPVASSIEGGLWAERRRFNREVLIPDGERRLKEAGNFDNLRAAAGFTDDGYTGRIYQDSDLHKWLEAVGHELAHAPDPELQRMADETTTLLEAAQDEDGYLDTAYQVPRRERWANLAWDHELYCMGHLIEAAVAQPGNERLQRGRPPAGRPPRRRLRRPLGHLRAPGDRARAGRPLPPDRRARLSRAGRALPRPPRPRRGCSPRTGARPTSRTASRCASRPRSRATPCARSTWPAAPPTSTSRPATRSCSKPSSPSGRTWPQGKTYITGGVGSNADQEAFGAPYDLPPDGYAETCAAIASVMLNWRLLLATGEARFADLLERTLYNGVLVGVARDRSEYAYENPLHVRDRYPRKPWYECACCPPNVMRTFASLPRYFATRDDHGVVGIHQYATGTFGGVRITTDYPWDGRIEIESAEPVQLRVPDWCTHATLNGARVEPGYVTTRGSAVLELDLTPRLTLPDPRIAAVRGCAAIERGPLVYCIEGDVEVSSPASTRRPADRARAGSDLLLRTIDRRRRGRRPGEGSPTRSCRTNTRRPRRHARLDAHRNVSSRARARGIRRDSAATASAPT